MTQPHTPTPPAGTRWREVAHPFSHGVWWRFTDRLQVKNDDNDHGWRDVSVLIDFGPEHIRVIHDLMQHNTEPLPAPVVDRGSEVWRLAREAIVHASFFKHAVPSWRGYETETDALVLALAPHWRELAKLAGETVPKVTVLEGWWNVVPFTAHRWNTIKDAEKETLPNDTHTAVRLAVVEEGE